MRMEKLTNKMQGALADAQSLALGSDNSMIEPALLISVLMNAQDKMVSSLIKRSGGDVVALGQELEHELRALPKIGTNTGEINVSPNLARVLSRADVLVGGQKVLDSLWYQRPQRYLKGLGTRARAHLIRTHRVDVYGVPADTDRVGKMGSGGTRLMVNRHVLLNDST